MKKYIFICIITFLGSTLSCTQNQPIDTKDEENRIFISHRGVHLKSTVAGENSLEAVRLAKIAGFGAIETDVRLSADSCLVIMHDSTLNRTCLNVDGTPLTEAIPVSSKTLNELKADYVLKATDPAGRSQIPTLREFLEECKRNELYTFIEPKIFDETGKHYKDIISLADEILGRDNYVITSNNKANRVIRGLGIDDVRLMGILYQTTFEEIQELGNTIMAISATRFKDEEYSQLVIRAKEAGLIRESHADKFKHFDRINNSDINYISTDILAPDLNGQGQIILDKNDFNDFSHSQNSSQYILLKKDELLELSAAMPKIEWGAIYLEMEMGKGGLEIELGNQKFTIESTDKKRFKYQPMIYNDTPTFKIKTISDEVIIKDINIKVVEFQNLN